jgi:AraC-like DNA-binding protein
VAPETTPGFRRVRYAGSDGTSYRAVFEKEYGGTDLPSADAGGEPVSEQFEYTVTGDDLVSLRTLESGPGRRSGTVGPRRDHVVFWLGRGRLTVATPDGPHTILPGVPWIASASSSFRFESSDTFYNGLHVADAFLREVAAETATVLPPGDLVFGQQDDRIAGLAPLRTLLTEVGPRFGDASLDFAARRALDARIAATVLETFPLTAGGSEVGASRRLRDAVAYVHARARDDISLSDIARAAGLSDRGVQQLFKRTLGTTPMSYLRDVRLDGIRQELVAARPGATGVGEIAGSWRLTHLGRFAAGYRARFGELPAETLRAQPR